MKYLEIEQLKTNLRLGKTVEQWLGHIDEEDYTVLKWLSLEPGPSGKYNVVYIESFDEGNAEFVDIYEFSALDPDEPYGLIDNFDTPEEAIEFCINKYGAAIDKFVSSGMIQEEYLIYLQNKTSF